MTLRLNGSTSGYTEIDAPAAAGSNTLILPTNNGTSGQALTTNGAGTLSWDSYLPASYPLIVAVAGGTETDLQTSFETRLSVNFTATAPRCLAIYHASVEISNTNANDYFLRAIIYDTVTATDVASADGANSYVGAGLGFAARIDMSVSAVGLTIGRVYSLRLQLRKTQANGPQYPRLMRIDALVI